MESDLENASPSAKEEVYEAERVSPAPDHGRLRRYIREHTPHEHLMIVPGARTEQVEGGRTQLWTVAGPLVNRTSRYRWMLDLPALLRILYQEHPEVVEAGDPYHAAMTSRNWANRRGSDFYMFYHSHFPDALLRTVLKFAGTMGLS